MSLRHFLPCLILSTLAWTPVVNAAPLGGQVVAGSGQIAQTGNTTTITQTSPTVALDWQSFNVAPRETVRFIQPNAQSLAVNHILGSNGSVIAGHLDANGQVWLINPNGVLFSPTATVNVGGLVASTLSTSGSTGGNTLFQGSGTASILNEGHLTAAPGGYVALLGNEAQNQGTISAPGGTVALAGGNRVLLQFQNNTLLNVAVDGSTLHNLAANGGLITAPGGQVQMTAGAADSLLASAVNNTGVIEAQTVADHQGRITLLGGMQAGTVQVAGTLDASAPHGGHGGSITTSAAQVQVTTGTTVTTAADQGTAGTWVIDPMNYTIAASGGDITGAQLSTNLGSGNIAIFSSAGTTSGNGDINIDDPVSWSANTSLTLTAANNINFNANVTATGATAGLVLNPNTANIGTAASGTGTVNFNGTSSVTLSGSTPTLSIGGVSYSVINSASALQAIGSAGNYALGSSLDLTGVSGFTPLGGSGFAGTFTGLGNTLTNLSITSSAADVGLFGVITSTGSISNVGLVGGTVSGSAANADIGALAGNNSGVISRAYATGSVTGTTLNAAVTIGGLVGQNGGTIRRSYATGAVSDVGGSLNSNDGGGLVGGDNGSSLLAASYATGNVSGMNDAGGLVGFGIGDIQNSYATGNVSGNTDVGGLIGLNFGIVGLSYATGTPSGGAYLGGFVGAAYGTYSHDYWDTSSSGTTSADGTGPTSGITGLSGAQMVAPSSFVGFNFASSFVTPQWAIYAGHTDPLLTFFLVPLTVTANSINATYSGSSYAGGLSGATYSVTGASSSPNLFNTATPYSGDVNTGAYAPSLWSNQQGYNLTVVGGTLTIAPATLTYAANILSTTYGSAIPGLSGNVSGFVGSDTLANATTGTMAFTTPATGTSNAGVYAIDGSGLTANHGNYVFQQSSANARALAIFPEPLSAASHVTRTYDGTTGASLGGSNTTLSGFVLGQNATVNGNVTGSFASANVGSGIAITGAALTASDLTAANGTLLSNYLLPLSDNGHGTITPATLTYTANPAAFLTGQAPSGLSGMLSGFVGSDALANATTGTLTWTTPAIASSAPGQYAIDGSGLTANFGNYVFQQAAGNGSALTLSPGTIAGFAAAVPGLAPLPVAIRAADTTVPAVTTVTNQAERAGIAQVRVINGGIRLPASMVVSQDQEAR